ncbi:MAG: ABC transporter permease, partial [Rhodanobacteraceae bacterium]
LGLKLVAGRDFRTDEYITPSQGKAGPEAVLPAVIISKALAAQLYPAHPERAVGQVVYYGMDGLLHGQGTRVVGVMADLQGMAASGQGAGGSSALVPVEQTGDQVKFALRSKPADRARVLKDAVATLARRQPQRAISAEDARTYTQIRAAHFSRDTTMISLLLAAAFGLLFVTALGIAGLASFWVGQRTRSIGVRRALGATRANILRYFQVENFMIVTAGIALGLLLAVGLNLLLMKHYEVSHLPIWYLPVTAVVLWLLGQIAVLMPALRASRVPPLVATRSAT